MYKGITSFMKRLLIVLCIILCTSIVYAFDIENENIIYSIDNFRIRFNGIIDFQTSIKESRLPAILKLNSTVYIPNLNVAANNYSELKDSNYYLTKISQDNIDCHVAFIYSINNTKWAYVSIDDEPIYCWVCTSNLNFSKLEYNNRYSSSQPDESILEVLLNNIYLGYSFIEGTGSGSLDGSVGVEGDFTTILEDNNGKNPIVIEAPRPYYEFKDRVQFIASILLSLVIMLIIIYIYTVVWGESSADTVYSLIVNGLINILVWGIILVRLVFIAYDRDVRVTDMSLITTLIILASCAAGLFNIDGVRVGRPILYTVSLNIAITAFMLTVLSTYSYYVGILNIWNSFLSPAFNTMSSFLNSMLSIIGVTFLIAVFNRYTFSYTEDRARIRTLIKTRYISLRGQIPDGDIELVGNNRKRSLMDRLYEDGLPTLNDFICELRNRANGIDGW